MKTHLLLSKTMALVSGLALCCSHLQAANVLEEDFAAWSPFQFVTDDPYTVGPPPNVSTGTGARLSSGGNPGAFFQLSHTLTSGDTSWLGAIKNDFLYEPAYDGAITNLSVTADISNSSGQAAWQVVVEQAGRRYYSVPWNAFSSGRFLAVSITNLTARDFDTNPWADSPGAGIARDGNRPDFSSTASPIKFGFMFGNRVIGNGSVTIAFGLDNFRLLLATSPRESRPRLDINVSQVELCWTTRTNEWYQLQYRSTASTNQWTPLSGNWIEGTGIRYCTTDAPVTGEPQKFYQVIVTNLPPKL